MTIQEQFAAKHLISLVDVWGMVQSARLARMTVDRPPSVAHYLATILAIARRLGFAEVVFTGEYPALKRRNGEIVELPA